MKKAIITGGAGFIGLHLARHLAEQGWAADLLDDFSRGQRDVDLESALSLQKVRLLEGNLAEPTFLETLDRDYTHIFHFAAILGVENVAGRPFEVLDVNVCLTHAAISLARRQRKLERFVFASTSEVYVGTLENFELPIPTPEATPLAITPLDRRRTSYMLSKIYGEALSLHSGLPVTIVRPHNVYGPRMGLSHVIPQLLERGHSTPVGGDIDVYSVDHTRTFCFIDDAVRMIARLAQAGDAVGLAVNVGTQEPEITIAHLAGIVIKTLGKPLNAIARPATEGSPARRAPDQKLCTELTGYRSLTSLDDGVAKTYAWYREHVFDV